MSSIFIHVYLDEDVDVLVASSVRSRGFEATTTQEAWQLGRSDAEQLKYAADQGFSILTHNRVDFEVLARRHFEEEKYIAASSQPETLIRKLYAGFS